MPFISASSTGSTSVLTCSGERLVRVYGTKAYGRLGMPKIAAERSASRSKPTAAMATDATPTFSNSIRSWTSHDVHDPQSAVDPTTTSHSLFTAFSTLWGTGLGEGYIFTLTPLKRALISSPTRSSA